MFSIHSNTTIKYPLLAVASAIVLLLAFVVPGCSTTKKAGVYRTPDDAVNALVKAIRTGNSTEIVKALGPGSEEIADSGDAVADGAREQEFIRLYDQHHELRKDEDGNITLVIGNDNWPFPIPLMDSKEGWRFDVATGKEEILARRIGRDEENAMQTCMAIVDAQRDYAEMQAGHGGVPEYAQKVISDAGKKNGLYWKVAEGEKPSPLGPLVAEAADEGYGKAAKAGARSPYHGYLYRLLTSQGADAPGGARDYMISGQMVGGFAVLAYPAQYGNSGIMSFTVSHDGVLYEADLGKDTAAAAEQITTFNPDAKWSPVKDEKAQ